MSTQKLHMNVHSSIIPICHKVGNNANDHELLNKMKYRHAMKYYSKIEKNEGLIHARSWMNLENSRLSKRSHTQKTTYSMILCIAELQNLQIQRQKASKWLLRAGGRVKSWGKWEVTTINYTQRSFF